MDIEQRIANLKLERDKKIKGLNEKINDCKLKIAKNNSKLKDLENKYNEIEDWYKKEFNAILNLTMEEQEKALVDSAKEKKLKSNNNEKGTNKEVNDEIIDETNEESNEKEKEESVDRSKELFDL